jgi:ABC-type protease/lipase transport system fused ATPase/permease subunit
MQIPCRKQVRKYIINDALGAVPEMTLFLLFIYLLFLIHCYNFYVHESYLMHFTYHC